MRLPALALTAVLAAGCGGDDPEDAQLPPSSPQPTPRGPVGDTSRADTMLVDTTVAGADGTERQAGTAAPGAGAGEAGPAADRVGRTDPGGQTVDGEATGGRLYTIQVGAFLEPATAREWEERLRSGSLPVWTSVAEVGGRTFHRLRVGAVATVDDARRLGALVTDRYEWPVWVAPITAADRLPPRAIQQTRRVLQGD